MEGKKLTALSSVAIGAAVGAAVLAWFSLCTWYALDPESLSQHLGGTGIWGFFVVGAGGGIGLVIHNERGGLITTLEKVSEERNKARAKANALQSEVDKLRAAALKGGE